MISINTHKDTPLYKQLYESMKSEILSGRMAAGTRLPATRVMALEYGLSRNTVINAYSQLELEGYIKARGGAGYYVERIDALKAAVPDSAVSNQTVKHNDATADYDYVFTYGNLDYSCYQSKSWRKCLTDACLLLSSSDKVSYQQSRGSFTLRQMIANYLYSSRGVVCSPEQIVLTNGHQHSVDIIVHLLEGSGRIFAMEDPGYIGNREILRLDSNTVYPVPLESDGISVEAVKALAKAILFVTPSHQFPMGSVLPIAKRLALIEWAGEADSYIIEDDYDSELRYRGLPIPSLQSMDTCERVIYLGTFSKSMSPDLRIAYMVLPKPLNRIYETMYSHSNCTVPTILQLALAEFIRSGEFQRHINAMRTHYSKKHDFIESYVNENLREKVRLYGVGAGLHFVIKPDSDLSQEQLLAAFAQKSIKLYPTEPFWIRKNECPSNELLMGFGQIPLQKLEPAMEAMTYVVKECL